MLQSNKPALDTVNNGYTQPRTNKHFSKYILQDLIKDYGYNSVATHDNTRHVIDALHLPKPVVDKVTIIGINGPTCSGKTSFTQAMVEHLSELGVPVIRIAFDWFLYERTARNNLVKAISQEHQTISKVTQSAWDTKRYTSLLYNFKDPQLANRRLPIRLTDLYDRTSGALTASINITPPVGGYAIVEGVGILDVQDFSMIDYHIRLDVHDDDILINRAIVRESSKPTDKRLSEKFLRERFEIMDLNHMRHLRKISYGHNQHIIDASDFAKIKLFSRSYE